MKTRLEKIKEANEVLNHNNPAWKEELDWVIEQAEKIDKIKKLSNAEDITLTDFAKETLMIIEGREKPIRIKRS